MNVKLRRAVSSTINTIEVPPVSESVKIRLRLIGQMEAWSLTEQNILPSGRKTRALLAVLALASPRPVLRGKLAEMLWSRRPEDQARASLRQEIHRLSDALGPIGEYILAISRDHLMLRPGMFWVDVEEVLRACPSKPTALSLFDGDLLEDLDGIDPVFDHWLVVERERLRDRARVLAEKMLGNLSEPKLAMAAAQQLLSIDRSHEGAWRALMRAYATIGERGMAIQAYERCRAVLADLLDAHPSEETQRLAADIRASAPVARPQPALASAQAGLRADLVRDLRQHSRGPSPDARPLEARAAASLDERSGLSADTAKTGPRIGVMPIQITGANEREARLALALPDAITSALQCFHWMSLVSASTLSRIAPPLRDESVIRRSFAIDYLLDGSLQCSGERTRICLRLLDLRAGNQIVWQKRFEHDQQEMFAWEDEISGQVAAALEPEMIRLEAARASARPPVEACAYPLVMRALPLIWQLEKSSFLQAGALLVQAMEAQADHVLALSWSAYWQAMLVAQGWAEDRSAAVAEATRLSERAIVLEPQNAQALTIAGYVRARLGGNPRLAMALYERALPINPHLSMAWTLSAAAAIAMTDLPQAELRLQTAQKLHPNDPHSYLAHAASLTMLLMRDECQAAASAGRAINDMNAGFADGYAPYLAILGHLSKAVPLGQIDARLQAAQLAQRQEVKRVRERLLAVDPSFTIHRFAAETAFSSAAYLERFTTGLRYAGVAE